MDYSDDDDNAQAPCLDALVSGTMALMTCAIAAPCASAACPRRVLLARKIVSNLFFLQHHPQARPALRQVFGNLHREWVGMLMAATQAAEAAQCKTAGDRGPLH